MPSTCIICRREWKVTPDDPVPCLSVSEPHNALDAFHGGHLQSLGAEKIVECSQFLELYGAGQELPPEIEQRVYGLTVERDAMIKGIDRVLRLAFSN